MTTIVFCSVSVLASSFLRKSSAAFTFWCAAIAAKLSFAAWTIGASAAMTTVTASIATKSSTLGSSFEAIACTPYAAVCPVPAARSRIPSTANQRSPRTRLTSNSFESFLI